jgi:CHAT domain-containing protein
LQAGITAYQQAIEKTSPDSPDLPGYLNNLGIGLTDRYLCLGELADLQAGIAAYQQAIDKTPYDSPDLPSMLNNLGTGLADRYSCLGELADLQAGIAAYQKAVKLGEKHSIADWLTSACNWLNWAFERNRWAEIEEAYPALQKASKQLVEKQLLREHKETVLKDTQGIAVKVAYARIQTGQLAGAVDALEQGVARLLSSTLARSDADLTPLQQDSPKLHKRYQLQLQAVNKAQHFYQNAPKDRLEKARIKWQNEEKRFNKLLKKIRKLSGHKNFLRIATDISTVRQVSQQQPLIYIFATEKGGYALNIFRGEIQAVALPELTTATVSKKIDSYFQVYIESDKPFFDPAYGYEDNDEAFNDWRHTIDSIKKWLYQAIMQPILQNIPPHPHIILIPIGALNLLPLHAAYLTADNQRHYMLDDYTISYAPNALSLQMARNRAEINPEKCLLIGNPEEDLPASDTEIIAIQKCFNISKKIERKQATKETVTSELNNDYSVLHFACHGEADRENPLEKTGLFMVNHEMLTVQDFLNANLNARLVGLSACETGIIGEKLPDEVVGLPTSLLQAGVAGVVASLWVADDFSTMLLMAQFYQRWFNEYPDNPAEALRFAQIWVRDSTQSKIEEFLKTFLSESEVNEILEDKEINFSHPYFWAAFSYTGV